MIYQITLVILTEDSLSRSDIVCTIYVKFEGFFLKLPFLFRNISYITVLDHYDIIICILKY